MFRRHIPIRACLVTAIMLAAPSVRDAGAEITAEQAQAAIDRGVRFLKKQQDPKGFWQVQTPSWRRGAAALAVLALLETGLTANDPTIRRALTHLRVTQASEKQSSFANYAIALETMVYCRVRGEGDRGRIRENVQWLQDTQIAGGEARGGWGYPGRGGDESNSQFALLALHEASLAGFEVKQETWRSALGYWQRGQRPSGVWGYKNYPGRASMTCAGVASVIIASSNINLGDARFNNGHCECGEIEPDEVVKKGLDWLGKNYSVSTHRREDPNAGKPTLYYYYYLYALERVGRVSARRLLYGPVDKNTNKRPAHDWYRDGARVLVDKQDNGGGWNGEGHGEVDAAITTSFALLFLAKGRRPVLVSKLQRTGSDWNRVRHDLTNLTRYTERKWKLPLTWQVIDANRATADDYSQTPVLFLSGSEPFQFTDDQRRELRRYVEQGGFIFADGCCTDNGFDASLRRELGEIFPESGYALQPLDEQHPIWSIDEKIEPKHVDREGRWLWGINFACKTSVVYCPGNLSCYWELASHATIDRFTEAEQSEIESCRAIGVNVLAYATNRRLKPKDAIPRRLAEAKSQEGGQRGHFAIAKLQHAGGCDAAPRAMTNLMEAVAHALDIRTTAKVPLISLTDAALFNYHFVYMHGRHDFRLNPQEKRQLKTFVDRGGIVLGDAICASPAFAKAYRREMRAVFGKPLEAIKNDHPLLTAQYGGGDLSDVVRRESVRERNGSGWEIREHRGPPELEGIAVDDRLGVIFSPLDLSCALEKHVSPHCRGYTPDDAARIAINVILYSLHE